MTSSAASGFDAAQAELFLLIERDPELRSSLSAIADEIEFSKTSVTDRSLSEWLDWLGDEGYDAQVVLDNTETFVALLRDAGIGQNIKSETSTDGLIQELGKTPNLLELLFKLVDHSSSLHAELVGAAGGTGGSRGLNVAQKLGVDRKKLASREAAVESASNLNDRGLEPRRDEINGQAQGAADRISTAREGQFMNDNSNLNDRGLEPRRDDRPTGGQRDANAEMRETESGMMGATENT